MTGMLCRGYPWQGKGYWTRGKSKYQLLYSKKKRKHLQIVSITFFGSSGIFADKNDKTLRKATFSCFYGYTADCRPPGLIPICPEILSLKKAVSLLHSYPNSWCRISKQTCRLSTTAVCILRETSGISPVLRQRTLSSIRQIQRTKQNFHVLIPGLFSALCPSSRMPAISAPAPDCFYEKDL